MIACGKGQINGGQRGKAGWCPVINRLRKNDPKRLKKLKRNKKNTSFLYTTALSAPKLIQFFTLVLLCELSGVTC